MNAYQFFFVVTTERFLLSSVEMTIILLGQPKYFGPFISRFDLFIINKI